MKLISICKWNELYENNRSRTVKDLSWVAIPNKHDGENYTQIVNHKDGSIIFAAFVLMVQVASKCEPRGTLRKDNGLPHTDSSLSVKTRAPKSWFTLAIEYLSKETDWLDIKDIASTCQEADAALTADCQASDEEGMEGMNGKKGGISGELKEVFDAWNLNPDLVKCLVISDKRKVSLNARLKDAFFSKNWRAAMAMLPASPFCMGRNDRGWKANFDWFLQPDTVAKIMEGKYHNSIKPIPSIGAHRLQDSNYDCRTPEEKAEQARRKL